MASYLVGIFLRTGERARQVKSPCWKLWEQRDASLNEHMLESETESLRAAKAAQRMGEGVGGPQ